MALVYQIIKSDSTRGGCCGYKSPPGVMAFVYQIIKSDSTRGGSWGRAGTPGVSDDSADGARRLFWRFWAKSFPRETLYLRSNTVEICDFLFEERNLVSGLKHSGDPTTKKGRLAP